MNRLICLTLCALAAFVPLCALAEEAPELAGDWILTETLADGEVVAALAALDCTKLRLTEEGVALLISPWGTVEGSWSWDGSLHLNLGTGYKFRRIDVVDGEIEAMFLGGVWRLARAGGSTGAYPRPEEGGKYVGTWSLHSSAAGDTVKTAVEMNRWVELTLRADGLLYYQHMFDRVFDIGTWRVLPDGAAEFTLHGRTMRAYLQDGRLAWDAGGTQYRFAYEGPPADGMAPAAYLPYIGRWPLLATTRDFENYTYATEIDGVFELNISFEDGDARAVLTHNGFALLDCACYTWDEGLFFINVGIQYLIKANSNGLTMYTSEGPNYLFYHDNNP